MLFEGNLDIISEKSETVVPLKIFEKCRLVGGGGRAPQGGKYVSQRIQPVFNNVQIY